MILLIRKLSASGLAPGTISTGAAEAIEELVRERFEEHGHLMVRIGRPPKRAFLFRTETPFAKITINFVGTEEKLELLCDGQQVVSSLVPIPTRRSLMPGSAVSRGKSSAGICRSSQRPKLPN